MIADSNQIDKFTVHCIYNAYDVYIINIILLITIMLCT